MMSLRGVSKSFLGKEVLCGFSAEFGPGTTCIMGGSGAGKTTLLNILMGLERQDAGTAEGTEGRKVSAIFQEDRLCESLGAVRNVQLVTSRPRAEIIALLEEMELAGSLFQPVSTLSGGMKRRVCIARALIVEADIYIFDEPLKGLDEDRKARIIEVMRRRTEGKTVIMVTHDIDEARAFGARVINLEEEKQC